MQTSKSLTSHTITSLENFISQRWLVLGYVVLLTGLFWLPSGSLHTKLFYALMAAPALIGLLLKPQQLGMIIREPIILTFVAFSAWVLISFGWTESDHNLARLAKRPVYIFLFMAGCAMIACKDQRLLLSALRIAAIIAALAALANLLVHLSINPLGKRLIGFGALRNPLLTSHVFGLFCTYWIASWMIRNEQRPWLALWLALPLLAALLATGSRTPIMALTLTCLWMLLLAGRRALAVLAAIALTGGVLALLLPEIWLERGTSFRPQLWSEALRQASEQIWLGKGYDSSFVFKVEGLNFDLSDPHNVELAVLLELGLIGLTLWLTLYGLALARCFKLRHAQPFQLASALIVYGFFAGMTEGSSFLSRPNENWFIVWIPLALFAALSVASRQSVAKQ